MKKTTFIFLIIFITLFLISCSGNPSVTKEPSQVLWNIDGNDSFQFTLNEFAISRGTEVNLTFKNVGRLDHNFIVAAADVDLFAVTEADALSGINTGIVQAGGEVSMTFTAPSAGTYTFVCVVPGHAAGGMVGTLTVTEGETVEAAARQ